MALPSLLSRVLAWRTQAALSTRRIALLAVPLLLVSAAAFARLGRSSATTGEGRRTCAAEKRDFVRTVRLNGVLEASHYFSVVAPRLAGPGGPLIITKLAPAGSSVKPGDVLVEFDPQTQLKNYLEKEAEYLGLLEQLKQKRAERVSAAGQDENDVARAQNDVDRARLDVSKSEVLSRIDADKNQQTLEEAQARLVQLKKKSEARGRAAAAEARSLELRAARSKRSMEYAQRNMERMQLRAPMEGVVVLVPIWKGGDGPPTDAQEGDEIRPGNPFMQVVDPATMQVRLKVNQADLHLLSVGQKAELHLDAYPDVRLPARIEQLGAVGSSAFSERVRVFTAIASIQGTEARMMPDLSAAVDVELQRVPDVLVLPRDAVTMSQGDQATVRLKNGRTRPVMVGAHSDHEIVVASGLDAGVEVLRVGDGS
jgi:multidrug resistance efflux pump